MTDYKGSMKVFQRQLDAKGISKEQFDIEDYAGLTARELQDIVDCVIRKFEEKKND